MRVQAFRAWFASALEQGIGAARRAGLAISRGIKRAAGKIDINVGVGEDESRFGQSGSRAWMQMLEEAKARLLQLFEKSYFERFPRFERFVRRILGTPAGLKKEAPKLAAPKPRGPMKLGAHTPGPGSAEAQRLREQVRLGMMQAHTHEHAGLREKVETHKRDKIAGDDRREHQHPEQEEREEEREPKSEAPEEEAEDDRPRRSDIDI